MENIPRDFPTNVLKNPDFNFRGKFRGNSVFRGNKCTKFRPIWSHCYPIGLSARAMKQRLFCSCASFGKPSHYVCTQSLETREDEEGKSQDWKKRYF
jgi:hypothetical protein